MSIKSDSRHLYLQVIDHLKQDIEKGLYQENEKLPSEFELAKKLGVSRATLREALRILEEEGYILRKHGVGTFINPKPRFSSGIENLTSVTKMIEEAGMKPGTIYLKTSTQQAAEEDMRRFGCQRDEEIVLIERVRTADGKPVIYCMDKIPESYFSENFKKNDESLFDMLEKDKHRRITHAVAEIEPIGYHEKVSPILECSPDSALLVLKQMHFDDRDQPVLYSVNYFKANMFSFHVVRKRV
ncbi:GntR family transcriptional regulator [Bacillus massiliglaciei]|uniref:GntR family transcriptional regulator n=1 Tax=Bacillus massiliglaciei TaxID=1816693 RepID=UPI000AA612C4|nr:GntR family transcriptional regulator [Bacillus massiliglaciei]